MGVGLWMGGARVARDARRLLMTHCEHPRCAEASDRATTQNPNQFRSNCLTVEHIQIPKL